MEYIKTYELFNNFSFFKKKKDPFSNPDIEYIVEESLIELSDLGFSIKVQKKMNNVRNGEGNRISSNPSIVIEIAKEDESGRYGIFQVSDVVEVLEFALPLLQREYGLELCDLIYRELEWTHRGNSGTKKRHSYNKLSRVKNMDTRHIDIELKDHKW
jgi:hypothetical protein